MTMIRISTLLSVTIDTNFTAQVLVDDPQNLGGFEFDLFFHPAILQVQGAQLGPLLSSTGRTTAILGPLLDHQAGTVALGGYSYGTQEGAKIGGVIGWITFRALALGNSELTLQNYLLADTSGTPVQATAQNAAITVTNKLPDPQIPSITNLSQDSATVGEGGITLTLTGANFVDGAIVLWNGQALPTQFVSSTQLKVEISAALLSKAEIVDIRVVNPTGSASNLVQFTVQEIDRRFIFLPLIQKDQRELSGKIDHAIYLPIVTN